MGLLSTAPYLPPTPAPPRPAPRKPSSSMPRPIRTQVAQPAGTGMQQPRRPRLARRGALLRCRLTAALCRGRLVATPLRGEKREAPQRCRSGRSAAWTAAAALLGQMAVCRGGVRPPSHSTRPQHPCRRGARRGGARHPCRGAAHEASHWQKHGGGERHHSSPPSPSSPYALMPQWMAHANPTCSERAPG